MRSKKMWLTWGVILILTLSPGTLISARAADFPTTWVTAGSTVTQTGYLISKDRLLKLDEDSQFRDLYEKQYNSCMKIAKRKWTENPEFNRWVGFLLGVGIAGLAVWGAGQLTH